MVGYPEAILEQALRLTSRIGPDKSGSRTLARPEILLAENAVSQELTTRGLAADGDGLANLVIG